MNGSTSMDIKVGKKAIAEATEKLKNWGRWGKDDHVGTLNQVTPQDIVKAASLIRTGKVFALGIPLDGNGPQNGLFGGRFNPIHQMLATGTDAIAGRQDWNRIRYADDTLMLCVQGATHWAMCSTRTRPITAMTPGRSTPGVSTCSASSIRKTKWSAAACCSTSRAF